MIATKNTYIKSAYKTLQVISQDEEKRMAYEAREKALRDYNQGMLEAELRGREIGRKEGQEIGRKEGQEIGRKEGQEIGRKEGQEIGRKEGIQALILDNLEEQITQERILTKLQKRFNLNETEAKHYYEQYSKLK